MPDLNNAIPVILLTKYGKINTSSTSKIKNTRAKRKNRIENGRRAFILGVNPHSNGLSFSRSGRSFIDKINPRLYTTAAKMTATKNVITNINIVILVKELVYLGNL